VYPLAFVASMAAITFMMAFAGTALPEPWSWAAPAVVLALVLGYELFAQVRRVRNATLRRAHFQNRFPSLDVVRSLQAAWKDLAFRRVVARLAMFVSSVLVLSWALIRVIHWVRDSW
jgi:hypothetical protein